MFSTIHNDKPATIYCLDTSVYASYDADNDVFYHADLDDDSVNLADDLSREFGTDLANDILTELGVI